MFYDNELLFLQKIMTKCHLQHMIIDPAAPLDENIDKGLHQIYDASNNNYTFYSFFPEIKPRTVYRVTDVFLCRYIFFLLPYTQTDKVFIIGPYLNSDISKNAVLEQQEKMGIPPKFSKEIEGFYASLPVIKEENLIFASVNSFAELIWDARFESNDLSRENSAAFIISNPPEKQHTEDSSYNLKLMEERYNYENDLMDAVSKGNTHRAELMLSSFSALSFESRAADPLRNMKNYCIIMNTLMRKAAENGGVHPIYLDRVSSDVAKRIEEIQSTGIVPDFMSEIIKTYCRLVKRHSVKNCSPIVQKAILQIENDLTGDLTLSAIARLSNVSPSYFSALFKKETGKTLTEYVNEKRIIRAKHLLKTTTLQIQTIAQHCGILDFHYFCRIFKKYTGKTPTEYKNSLSFD